MIYSDGTNIPSGRPWSSFCLNQAFDYSTNFPLTCFEHIEPQFYELQNAHARSSYIEVKQLG